MNKRDYVLAGCMALTLGATAQTSLPFSESFDSPDAMSQFTVVDANEDGVTWKYDPTLKLVRYDYNDYKAADDWLFLPQLNLKKDKTYKIQFTTQCRSVSAIEKVEVTIGKSADAASQKAVAEPLSVVWTTAKPTEYTFSVEEDGTYSLAFHEISDAGKYYLLLDDIKVSEVVDMAVPGAVSDVILKPADKGEHSVTVSFKTPANDADGQPLKSLTKVSVYREDLKKVIKTYDKPEIGTVLSFIDEVPTDGIYNYSITASNEGGDGESVSKSVYAGYDQPVEVDGITAMAEGKNVRLAWKAPTRGTHEGFVDTESLRYNIIRNDGSYVAKDVTETVFTDNTIEYQHGPQTITRYTIEACNKEQKSNGAMSPLVLSGEPIKAPFDESFSMGGTEYYPWYSENTYNGKEKYWDLRTYGASPQCYASDDDAGLLMFRSYAAPKDYSEYFFSPMFDISEMVHPIFVWHMYHSGNASDTDKLVVEFAKDGGEFKPYGAECVLGAEQQGWKEYYAELDDLKDSRFVQLGLHGISQLGHNIHVDQLALIDNCYDVAPTSLEILNSEVTPNTDFTATATVENTGNKTVENIEVRLLRNGETVSTKAIDKLEPASKTDVEFVVTEGIMASDTEATYSVETFAEQDEKPANNKFGEVTVAVLKPSYPTPSNLKAEANEKKAILTWEPAQNATVCPTVTDGFEDYDAFAISGIGSWTMVDVDKEKSGDWYLKYDNVNEPMAFQVFNPEKAGVESSDKHLFAPHNGSQYLISFFNDNYEIANDDWMISPEIDPTKGVSIYAKSLSSVYSKETFEVLYSENTTDIDDFKLLANETVPFEWTQYIYTLPNTAKYFAIRHTSINGTALMIDDVAYAPKSGATEETAVGYNIYRDDELLNEAPIAATTYTDEVDNPQSHKYKVTAVFASGESFYAGPVTPEVSTRISDTTAQGNNGWHIDGSRLVTDAGNNATIEVYSTDGHLAGRISAVCANGSIQLKSGVYLVKSNGTTTKITCR